MTVAEAQTLCLKQGTPFYSYRLPGERESVFGAQLDGEVAPFRQVGEQRDLFWFLLPNLKKYLPGLSGEI
jgi:hypothetical protein